MQSLVTVQNALICDRDDPYIIATTLYTFYQNLEAKQTKRENVEASVKLYGLLTNKGHNVKLVGTQQQQAFAA